MKSERTYKEQWYLGTTNGLVVTQLALRTMEIRAAELSSQEEIFSAQELIDRMQSELNCGKAYEYPLVDIIEKLTTTVYLN